MRTRSSTCRALLGLLLLGASGCMSQERVYSAFYDTLRSRQQLVDARNTRSVGDDRPPTYAEYDAERKRRANDSLTD